MTKSQRIILHADWWPAACRAQAWKTSDRDLRIRVCAWAVNLVNPTQLELLEAINSDRLPGRRLDSTNDLNSTDDIDRVKGCLGMLADKMKETREVGQPQIGRGRRLRDVIRDQTKCLALYQDRPRAYVAGIINDKFNHGQRPHPLTIRDLDDEGKYPSQLDQLVMTLARIVNQKRNKNEMVSTCKHLQGTEPLTIHEMKVSVGAHCDCAICAKLVKKPLLPPLQEDWSEFDPESETIALIEPQLGRGDSNEPECPF